MTIEALLSRLDGVRQTGDRQWSARCPCHDDRVASLSVAMGENGKPVLHDHGGCDTRDVLDAVGLTFADLMADGQGNDPSPARSSNGAKRVNGSSRLTLQCTYDYVDEAGNLLYQVCRFVDENGKKTFRQRKPNGAGGWQWKAGDRLVLYRLPELLAASPGSTVFVCEGEKDVDRLRSLGLLATCNVGGASASTSTGKWRDEYSEHLAGFRVVALRDNDDAGAKHVHAVATSVHGHAASVKIIEFEGLPEHGDVSDWFDSGHTVEELRTLVEAVPEWAPTARKTSRKASSQSITITAETLDLLSPAARTDVANARRFSMRCGEDVRWCEPWGKWLVWDGRRWALDGERRIDALAKQVADAVWSEAASLLPQLDYAAAKEVAGYARATASAKGISAMLALAKSEPGIPVLPDKLDADPWRLNVANGTLDLRTGTLRPHERGDLLTKLCPVEFDPAATCSTWERMLDTILGAELTGYMRRAVGYSLTGSVQEQCLFLCHGAGANGKSTFLNALLETLGNDYSMQAADGLLMVRGNEAHPTERADLFGKRFVSSVEIDDGRRFAESLVKQLTGGDVIRARRMRENFWEYIPTHKLWMAVNHKPVIRGTDHGIWRRVKLVPFSVTIADAEQDKDLPDKLRAERPGILAWAVRGCMEWNQSGLGEPPEITAATSEYRGEMDVIGSFLADCCRLQTNYSTRSALVYATYQAWCRSNGEFAVNQRRFGLAMTERGFERYTNNGTFYRGIELITEGTEPCGTNF